MEGGREGEVLETNFNMFPRHDLNAAAEAAEEDEMSAFKCVLVKCGNKLEFQ